MHITLPCCASAAIDNNSGSIMTIPFLFLGASDNQQVGHLQAEAAATV